MTLHTLFVSLGHHLILIFCAGALRNGKTGVGFLGFIQAVLCNVDLDAARGLLTRDSRDIALADDVMQATILLGFDVGGYLLVEDRSFISQRA